MLFAANLIGDVVRQGCPEFVARMVPYLGRIFDEAADSEVAARQYSVEEYLDMWQISA